MSQYVLSPEAAGDLLSIWHYIESQSSTEIAARVVAEIRAKIELKIGIIPQELRDRDGVFTIDAPNNIIGGTSTGAGNVISANGTGGVRISSLVGGTMLVRLRTRAWRGLHYRPARHH